MKKILIVEDNQVVISIYRNKLQAEGFRVEVASDGEAALEMVNSFNSDLVLLDLMLPKLSGTEVLQKLRSQPAFEVLPIIVFSNAPLSSTVKEAWQGGATQVITKVGHSPKKVVEIVRNALAVASQQNTLAVPPSPPPPPSPPLPLPSSLSPPLSAAVPAATVPVGHHTPAAVMSPVASHRPLPAKTDEAAADAEFQGELQKMCLDAAPETFAKLKNSLQAFRESGGGRDPLFEVYQKVHSLAGNAGLAGLDEIFRLAAPLETLLKALYEKSTDINASTIRTVAQSIEALALLFKQLEQGAASRVVEAPARYIPRALVVDDEEIARRAVSYALEKADVQQIRVADSATALNVLAENSFDIVFLDVEMPGVGGIEVCAKLRLMPLHRKTPVVFITTAGNFDRLSRSDLSRENDALIKPFLYTEVIVKALTLLTQPPGTSNAF